MNRFIPFFTLCMLFVFEVNAQEALPFTQDWSNTGLITTDDDWSGVDGIIAFRGDGLGVSTGIDPQTILADGTSTPVDVNANEASTGLSAGGIAEFDGLANPTVAFQGSGTADAPFILISVSTTGLIDITVQYNLRELDSNDATQQVALHYRVGNSGNFTNIPSAYVADASNGSSQVTPINVILPVDANNESEIQIRMMTTNASGTDSFIGVDDINITGSGLTAEVPSLSQWGLIILALLFMTFGTVYIREMKLNIS